MRQKLWNLADVLFTFLFYYVAGLTIHEWAHYTIGTALGYTAEAHFSWFGGYVLFHQPLTLPHVIAIGIAGGAITGAFMLLISVFTSDWEEALVTRFFFPLQFIYAAHEVLYLLGYVPLWALGTLPVLWVAIIFMAWYLWPEEE